LKEARAPQPQAWEAALKAVTGPGEVLMDVGKGFVKKGLSRVSDLSGFLQRNVPGVSAIESLWHGPEVSTTPTNMAQQAGGIIEQGAEFMVPASKVGAAIKGASLAPRMLAQGATAGGVGLAQGQTPGEAAVSSVLGGAGELLSAAEMAKPLRDSAVRSMEQTLAPTTNANKVLAERVAPKMVDRGVRAWTRGGLRATTKANKEAAGEALETAFAGVAPDKLIKTQNIIDALEKSKWESKAIINGVNGPIVVEPGMVAAADDLAKVVEQFGPDASFDSMLKLKQRWGETVAKAKGFTQPDVSVVADVKRDAVKALRDELVKAEPDLAKLNAEYNLWANADKVINDTIKRTRGQSTPLGEQIGAGAGAAAGLATGGIGAAIQNAAVVRVAVKLMRSTAWRTVSAQTKNALAKAIANNDSRLAQALIVRTAANLGMDQQ
jgi:hypothetical protein